MSGLKRHVGRITNTGARCIVVFRKIPGDDTNCLVVESDRLPELYHDNIMTILNSREAQDVVDFYNVLHRRTFADGGNCLQTLHEKGLLRKINIEMVEMVPYPNRAVPLLDINTEIDGVQHSPVNENVDTLPEVSLEPAERPAEVVESMDDPDVKATSLIDRALLMEQTAAQLKEEAYMLVPKLRPGRGRPRLTEDQAEAKREERNRKRRERYAKEQAEAKANPKAKAKAKAKPKAKAKAKAKPKAKTE